MIDINLLILFATTLLGAVTSATLGWLDSGNPFDAKKFFPSLIRGVIAASSVFAVTFTGIIPSSIDLFTLIGAFFIGGGFDATVNRLSGIVQEKAGW